MGIFHTTVLVVIHVSTAAPLSSGYSKRKGIPLDKANQRTSEHMGLKTTKERFLNYVF